MQLYEILDRIFPSSYAAKLSVGAVASGVMILLGFAAYLVVTQGGRALLSPDLLVLGGLSVFGVWLNVMIVATLLRPLGALGEAMRSVHRDRISRPLPNGFADELGAAMRLSNRLAEDLGARLHGDMVKASDDPLTGALRRPAFLEAMTEAGAGAIMVLRVGDFPGLRSTHGEDSTARALASVGRVLTRATRPGDLICRYDEAEFAVFLAGAGKEVARHVADRIRADVLTALQEVMPDAEIHAGLAPRLQQAQIPALWSDTLAAIDNAGAVSAQRVIIAPAA